MGVVVEVVRTERVRGLWRGVTPSVVRTVPGVGLYFSVLHAVKSQLDIAQVETQQRMESTYQLTEKTVIARTPIQYFRSNFVCAR